MRTLKLAAAAVTALALAAPVAMAGSFPVLSGTQKEMANGTYAAQVHWSNSPVASVISGQGKS